MRRFAQLYEELDRTTRTSKKQAALERYIRAAPPADAAWGLHILLGRGLVRGMNRTRLREWVAEEAGLPLWMIDECRAAVGDFSETLALLLPERSVGPLRPAAGAYAELAAPPAGAVNAGVAAKESLSAAGRPLHRVVVESILPLPNLDTEAQRALLVRAWHEFDRGERFIFHKLISGVFRVGAAARLVTRALATVAGVAPAVMAHRLMGSWRPTADAYAQLLAPSDGASDPSQPYPFCLAYPIEDLWRNATASVSSVDNDDERTGDDERGDHEHGENEPLAQAKAEGDNEPLARAKDKRFDGGAHQAGAPVGVDAAPPPPTQDVERLNLIAHKLGPAPHWLAEWKWDGVRAQLIRRNGQTWLWSRGEELINSTYPELLQAAAALPDGTVLDGEILAWEGDHPLPFNALQQRLNRKRVEISFWPEVPIAFLAFDLLELNGDDLRSAPLSQRRAALDRLVLALSSSGSSHAGSNAFPVRAALTIPVESWEQLAAIRQTSRARGTEGLMLKKLDAAYGTGRQRGPWWKWKIDPCTVDAVLIYAQAGSGKRATLFTDYTFGVWENGELVPVAKAYSGLTDEEINRVDRFVRTHTLGRQGPFRAVKPELVFELGFEGIQKSSRHKAGLALRFPRMLRWRTDKRPEQADTLEALRSILKSKPVAPASSR